MSGDMHLVALLTEARAHITGAAQCSPDYSGNVGVIARIDAALNSTTRMREAIETVLAHVENMDVARVGNQCTLCFSHRKLLRDALAEAM